MKLDSLHSLYVHQLKDLYSAEQQIVSALPKMAKAAASNDLKQAFENHLTESRIHVERLHGILHGLDENVGNTKCKGMEGLLEEGEEVLNAKGDAATKDAALIAAVQRVEHYEMAGYGTVRTYADRLGYNEASSILQQTLDEEAAADKKLTGLAEGEAFTKGITGINERANK